MNTHLHVMEADANLLRAWDDTGLREKLAALVRVTMSQIVDTQTGHFKLFFDAEWNSLEDIGSYGHDIEAAWLLCEAAEVLGDEERQTSVHGWALELARSVSREALDPEGGLAYEGRDGEVIDPDREWWCQAEAIVGFWQAYRSTGEAEFAEAASRVWSFIENRVVDRVNGEWFWRVFADGSVDESEPKVSEWKGPYHNTRMCLEMLRRIGNEE